MYVGLPTLSWTKNAQRTLTLAMLQPIMIRTCINANSGPKAITHGAHATDTRFKVSLIKKLAGLG